MAKSKKDFYPLLMRCDPPYVMTRATVDEYFSKRGTHCKVTHIPATCPREENVTIDLVTNPPKGSY